MSDDFTPTSIAYRIGGLDRRVDALESDMRQVKDVLQDVKAEVSDTRAIVLRLDGAQQAEAEARRREAQEVREARQRREDREFQYLITMLLVGGTVVSTRIGLPAPWPLLITCGFIGLIGLLLLYFVLHRIQSKP